MPEVLLIFHNMNELKYSGVKSTDIIDKVIVKIKGEQ